MDGRIFFKLKPCSSRRADNSNAILFFHVSSLIRPFVFGKPFSNNLMQTYLRISKDYSNELASLHGMLQDLCEKIENNGTWTSCFPKGGNLLSVIQLLSRNQIQYEIQVQKRNV